MLSLGREKISEPLTIARGDVSPIDLFTIKGSEINKDFKDYKSALAETIEYNLSILDELPSLKNLPLEEIKEHFKKIMEEDIRKDPLFEKSVEIKKYTSDISKYLVSYFKEVFDYQKNKEEKLDSRLFDSCRLFYNSDLPLQFLTTIEEATLVQKDFVHIYEKRLHKEHLQLMVNRSNHKKFGRICDEHNRWIKPLNEQTRTISRLWLRLFWYVDFSNSSTVENLFEVKPIKSDCLDMTAIQDLMDKLKKETDKMEGSIESSMEFKPYTSFEDNSGARAIRKIMELLSTTEG